MFFVLLFLDGKWPCVFRTSIDVLNFSFFDAPFGSGVDCFERELLLLWAVVFLSCCAVCESLTQARCIAVGPKQRISAGGVRVSGCSSSVQSVGVLVMALPRGFFLVLCSVSSTFSWMSIHSLSLD